jgi:radical SAM superfamily enzyme YgiQ (UPF0313 family)
LKNKIDNALKFTGKIGLVSALPNSHPEIKKIANYILDNNGKPSFSSIRLELIDNDFLEIFKKSGQNTLTLAPESANIQVRKNMGKGYDNGKIVSVITTALSEHIRNFKLYFMAGLPGDDKAEDEIIMLCKKIRKAFLVYAKSNKIMPDLTLDISLFVPKPFTKWENKKLMNSKDYVTFIKYLRKELFPLGIKIKNDDAYQAKVQYILSREDNVFCGKIIEYLKQNKPVRKLIKHYKI